MRCLLDTHVLLWWITDSPRLSTGARRLIGETENENLVSAVAGWKISVKYRLGKLRLTRPAERWSRTT